MKKKIIIILAVIVVILIAAFMYLNNRNRTLSPPGSAELSNGDLKISLTYSRPSVKGRLIFGTKEEKALLPYDVYWRLGANESTEVTFSEDVSFNGEDVTAGTYRMYAIPGPDAFEVRLNSELGKWGYFEPDYTLDVIKTTVTVEKLTTPVELFTITLKEANNGIDIVCEWADTRFSIPVRKKS